MLARAHDWFRRHAVGVIVAAMALTGALWVGALAVLSGLDDVPAWWPGIDPEASATRDAADRLERAFANQASAVRAPTDENGADWAVAVNQDSANAWLAVRLRGWAIDAGAPWPEGVAGVRVAFLGESVAIGAMVSHGEGGGASVLWLEFEPEIRADGSVWVRARRARIGSVPVPMGWVLDGFEREAAGAAGGDGRVRAVLTGREPATEDPVVHLPDGRDVRVTAMTSRAGRVELSMRTERGG